MADWKFWARDKSPTKRASAGTDAEGAPVYVEALLKHMLRTSKFHLTLRGGAPLPVVGTSDDSSDDTMPAPDFLAVTNCLKILSGVNPFPCQAPVEGRFERPRGDHVVIYETRFDDRAQPPTCTVRMTVRRRNAGAV